MHTGKWRWPTALAHRDRSLSVTETLLAELPPVRRTLAAVLVVGVASIAGVEAGVQIATRIPDEALRRLFGVLVLLVAAQLTWQAWRRPRLP